MRIGLVGCAKTKRQTTLPARHLYNSAMFNGRVRYVERTCDCWYILSAKHGLLRPDKMTPPYDRTLNTMSREDCEAWSQRVLEQLDAAVASAVLWSEVEVEIHAGAAYRDHGVVAGLVARGACVVVPAAGLSQGEQLRLYSTS